MKIKIDESEAKEIYKEAPEWLKKILTNNFGKELFKKREFTDIKTLADAELVTGKKLRINDDDTEDEIAYKSLKIIIEAINPEGWKDSIDWNNKSQQKWVPRFNCSGRFGFFGSYCSYTHANSNTGSWLCFSSEDQSDYTGKQFLDLYEKMIK